MANNNNISTEVTKRLKNIYKYFSNKEASKADKEWTESFYNDIQTYYNNPDKAYEDNFVRKLINSSENIYYNPNTVEEPNVTIKFDESGLKKYQKKVMDEFITSLKDNKKEIQKFIGLDNDTYNMLCRVAIGIVGVESDYGKENNILSDLSKSFFKIMNPGTSPSPSYKREYEGFFGKGRANLYTNSIGLTQIKLSNLDPRDKNGNPKLSPGENSLRNLYAYFGITKDSLVYDPKQAAIATILKLGAEYKRLRTDKRTLDDIIRVWNPGSSDYVDKVKHEMERVTILPYHKKGGFITTNSLFSLIINNKI